MVDGNVISGASEGGGDEELPTAPRNGSGARQDSVRRNSWLKCLVMLATDDGRWDVHGIADVMNSISSSKSSILNYDKSNGYQ